ncbi:MAG: TRAP-type C4-dicarboxylate transport system, small permease component [Chloroflexi bacterium]|nr:TRAP-type C4-dicarboxylate transport system, small permease component [Chloroflexota bacterium]
MILALKRIFNKIVDWFCISAIVLMLLITFYQVVARYIFSNPSSWSEEVARYISVWAIFLGAAIAFRSRAHLGVDYFVTLFSKRIQTVIGVVTNIVLLATLVFIFKQGIEITLFVKNQLSPAMRISMAIPYAAIPTGVLLMFIELVWDFFIRESIEAREA